MTVATALAVGVMRLRSKEAAAEVQPSAAADAQRLLGEVLGADRTWLIAHAESELDGHDLDAFGILLDERMRGVPIPYLTHACGFFGREFYVDERVLVPRPETEHLVEAALEDLRSRAQDGHGLRALDVGTGSGAIAVTLAAELPGLAVTATDTSGDALQVARLNAGSLGVDACVRFVESDLSEALGDTPFDCIIANLPYIPTSEIPMPPDPVGFEPRVALDGGTDGLDAYRKLASRLPSLVARGASVFLEAAPPTIEGLESIVRDGLAGASVRAVKDYAGLYRFVVAKFD